MPETVVQSRGGPRAFVQSKVVVWGLELWRGVAETFMQSELVAEEHLPRSIGRGALAEEHRPESTCRGAPVEENM